MPSSSQTVTIENASLPVTLSTTLAPIQTQAFLPAGAKVYQGCIVDDLGTVAAKNFMSLFNPLASGKTLVPLGFVLDCHTNAATTSDISMTIFRTSAASAGTLFAANTVTRFVPTDSDPLGELRTGNPTVTTTGRVLIGMAPAIYPGGGGGNPAFVTPSGGFPIIPAGTGIVFGTSAGDVDQRWNLQLTWMEF